MQLPALPGNGRLGTTGTRQGLRSSEGECIYIPETGSFNVQDLSMLSRDSRISSDKSTLTYTMPKAKTTPASRHKLK
ncbi:hypothetical protein CDV36_003098 [Fusarium kuroshium]|uniref:Uncharacterized protein n=1 Tax=Fusarium kuroshium TaxID=2010991 RepID=A0A3M2SIA4_9HYPO|nr:hypothetical protein CDV36_003098 [Fusarium kuroshium]